MNRSEAGRKQYSFHEAAQSQAQATYPLNQ